MLRGIWGDPSAIARRTGARFEGRYFAGDGAKIDDDGYLWLLGRVDDVMNVSGHRISTTEVESRARRPPHRGRGGRGRRQRRHHRPGDHRVRHAEGRHGDQHRARRGAAPARGCEDRPDAPAEAWIIFTDELPKTRSGKIMRRLLKDVAEGRDLGDTTTLADPYVVD